MPTLKLPLSGNVTQSILPWNFSFVPTGGQWGLVNISLGRSSDPDMEQTILDDVGSYGRQLGRVSEALGALIDALQPDLSPSQREAVEDFQEMLREIAKVKQRRSRKTR